MSEDEDNAEFEELIERMADPDSAQRVEVTEVAEKSTVVEVIVPISVYPQPELTLFRTIISYLESGPRRAITGISINYEVRSHNMPHLSRRGVVTEPTCPTTVLL